MSEPRYKKLVAMGIACLVATGRQEVLERLDGEIFNLWLDVFGEMKESLQKLDEGNDEYAEILSHALRRRSLTATIITATWSRLLVP